MRLHLSSMFGWPQGRKRSLHFHTTGSVREIQDGDAVDQGALQRLFEPWRSSTDATAGEQSSPTSKRARTHHGEATSRWDCTADSRLPDRTVIGEETTMNNTSEYRSALSQRSGTRMTLGTLPDIVRSIKKLKSWHLEIPLHYWHEVPVIRSEQEFRQAYNPDGTSRSRPHIPIGILTIWHNLRSSDDSTCDPILELLSRSDDTDPGPEREA